MVTNEEETIVEDDQIVDDQSVDFENEEVVEEESSNEETEIDENEESEDDESEMIVTIGDEQPEEEPESKVFSNLRKRNREMQKELKELRKLREQKQGDDTIKLPKKPTIEDFDYDSDKYSTALEKWFDDKRKFDQQEAEKQNQKKAQREEWQGKLDSYEKGKASMKVKDFQDVEETVTEMLNQTQQGVIIQGADNPALLVYALGKNKKKLKELSEIKDPVKYAFALAKVEAQLKVSNKKPPKPESIVRGSGGKSSGGAPDATLERLREEAARTGNYSKVHAYKKKHKKG